MDSCCLLYPSHSPGKTIRLDLIRQRATGLFWVDMELRIRDGGDTETRIEDIDLILQYGRFLSEEKGRSWYKTRHELLIEIPVYIVYKPESAVMTGINFLSCWNFTASEEIIPYIFTGGGFMYTSLDEPGLGTDYNGNYQAGVGIHYFIKENTTIDFNYRYHHISNADTAEPNEPLNSTKTFVGLSFFLD